MTRKMKKSETRLLGILIVVGLVIYLLLWLYQKVGLIGYLAIALSMLTIWFYGDYSRRIRFTNQFERDALYTLNHRVIPDIASKMNAKYMRISPRHSELLRCMQIFNDSVHIALNSKKMETAVSRMESVRQMYQNMKSYRGIQTKRVVDEIETIYSTTVNSFPEVLCLNVANGYLDKSEALKTAKGKHKYLLVALEVLNDEHDCPTGKSSAVKSLILKIEAEIADLPRPKTKLTKLINSP